MSGLTIVGVIAISIITSLVVLTLVGARRLRARNRQLREMVEAVKSIPGVVVVTDAEVKSQ